MNLIFDLDGTLIDSSLSIEKTLDYVARELKINLPVNFNIKNIIGNPLYDTFFSLTGNAAVSEAALIRFRQVYKDEFILGYTLYPYAVDFIQAAEKNNHHIFLVTNKAKLLAEIIIKHANLHHYFSGVYGPELNRSVKKRELLEVLLKQNPGVNESNSIFIGDTLNDLEAAEAFDLETIIMLHGYGSKEDFKHNTVKKFCPGFEALRNYLLQPPQYHAAL